MRFSKKAIRAIREYVTEASLQAGREPAVTKLFLGELEDILKNRRKDTSFAERLWLIADVNFALWSCFYSDAKTSGSVAAQARELTVQVVLLALRHWIMTGELAVRID